MRYIPTSPDTTETLLYNPSKRDFTYPMADDNNVIQQYTLPSRTISKFPKYIADHLAKHLAQTLASEGDPKVNYIERYNEWISKIYVVI